jgi:hypothetical protein
MTGRWFYEVSLISDGLMQIGWANALFRCDPICGQGVGDHMHSWAFDGLRSKKWNVSCDSYGRRWRIGDTVGVLVDMDLLEMRFYLNGEDLGPAFEDFSSYELFPAFSLNVRQCIRLNFGQYKFQFPPDEIDGKPFKSIVMALTHKQQSLSPKVSTSKKNPIPPPLINRQDESVSPNMDHVRPIPSSRVERPASSTRNLQSASAQRIQIRDNIISGRILTPTINTSSSSSEQIVDSNQSDLNNFASIEVKEPDSSNALQIVADKSFEDNMVFFLFINGYFLY